MPADHVIEAGEIFVFGSNLAGKHGKGAALYTARSFGAVYGNPSGLQGSSYAIPTKDSNLKTLPINVIQKHVEEFLDFANSHRERKFFVTAVGTGLAGLSHEVMSKMFTTAGDNVRLPPQWVKHIRSENL